MSLVTDGPVLLALPVAVAAGVVSFLSPCVLPLVPGYLSYVTGLSGADLAGPASAEAGAGGTAVLGGPGVWTGVAVGAGTAVLTGKSVLTGPSVTARRRRSGRVVVGAGLFVAGFTAVYTAEGALFGSLGQLLAVHQQAITRVLGVVTVVLGLAFAGVLARVPGLGALAGLTSRDARLHRMPPAGLAGAPVLGVVFGLGWTPCIGPTLALVLGLSASSATAGRGALLTAAYCLGLGAPFVLVALAFRRTMGALTVVRRHYAVVMAVGGTMLVMIGLLQVSGLWDSALAHLRPYVSGFTPSL